MKDPRTFSEFLKRVGLTALCIGAFLCLSPRATAEIVGSGFGGLAFTENNDLRFQQPGGTDLTFHNVSYRGRNSESPPYYGGRLVYFPSYQSHWGFGAEFFHSKMYLNASETAHVTGTRAGAPVDTSERIDNTIQAFNISHGLNFLLADASYRWFLGERGKDFLGRLQPYLGAGVGAVMPHVEISAGNLRFEQYQWHGPGVEGFAGMNFDLIRHLSLFVEYKFTYANLDHLDFPGGFIEVTPLTHHLVTGISINF